MRALRTAVRERLPRELGIAVEAGFLLVASEYSSDCAQVVEPGSGEVVRVFDPSATAAVWVPAPRSSGP